MRKNTDKVTDITTLCIQRSDVKDKPHKKIIMKRVLIVQQYLKTMQGWQQFSYKLWFE